MRLRLVPRLERSRARTLCPPDWRLSRRAARGPEQREPGSGIDAGLSPVAGGNAADTKHRKWRSASRSGGPRRPMRHAGEQPYGISDYATTFATLPLDQRPGRDGIAL